jgi:hypothetical protein
VQRDLWFLGCGFRFINNLTVCFSPVSFVLCLFCCGLRIAVITVRLASSTARCIDPSCLPDVLKISVDPVRLGNPRWRPYYSYMLKIKWIYASGFCGPDLWELPLLSWFSGEIDSVNHVEDLGIELWDERHQNHDNFAVALLHDFTWKLGILCAVEAPEFCLLDVTISRHLHNIYQQYKWNLGQSKITTSACSPPSPPAQLASSFRLCSTSPLSLSR